MRVDVTFKQPVNPVDRITLELSEAEYHLIYLALADFEYGDQDYRTRLEKKVRVPPGLGSVNLLRRLVSGMDCRYDKAVGRTVYATEKLDVIADNWEV